MPRFLPGYSTVDWGPDHFLKALHEISVLGFSGVEIGTEVVQIYEGRAEEFVTLLRKVGLRLAAVFTGLVLDDPEYREADVEVARQASRFLMEVSQGGILVAVAEDRDEAAGGALRAAAETLLALAGEAGEADVRICVKPQRGTAIETGQDLADLLELTKEAGDRILACLDTAHLVLAGTDPIELIGSHPRRIGHVHLTDLGEEAGGAGPPLVDAGIGVVPLVRIMEALRASPYEGWIVGRVDTPASYPGESARACASFFRNSLYLPVEGAGGEG